ncbi:MAG TPA: rod shape-determining protein MreD [Vicinamibacteria bacterium]|nr:rod shape-determining protein MreD [Vicinamibacteria bacterium]
MSVFWTAVALVTALAVQTALSLIGPGWARILDPFLLVVVYCGLKGGETHGMLAGAAAGWMQDVHFGGRVLGLAGLTKVLVGFGVGLAGTRFQLTEPGARLLVVVAAVIIDALVLGQLARAFDVVTGSLTLGGLALRAGVNAAIGVPLFALVERRRWRWSGA